MKYRGCSNQLIYELKGKRVIIYDADFYRTLKIYEIVRFIHEMALSNQSVKYVGEYVFNLDLFKIETE